MRESGSFVLFVLHATTLSVSVSVSVVARDTGPAAVSASNPDNDTTVVIIVPYMCHL